MDDSSTAFLPVATDRLRIRTLVPADAEAFAAYRSDPDVARYQSWSAPYPLASARQLIDGQSQLDGPTAGEWVQLAIEADGVLVGDVAVGLSGDGHTATIGYTLVPAHQGKGLATEAVAAVVDRLFEHSGVHRVEASVDPRNIASARIVEQVGFDFEGTAVSSVLADGEWTDDDRYALTADAHAAWGQRVRTAVKEVHLREVTAGNARALLALRTHRTQQRFVAPMAASFANALAPEVVHGAALVPWLRGIEADGELVGFVMIAEGTPTSPEPYLWRLLIDRRHQRRGIGSAALRLLFECLRAEGHRALNVSWVPGPGGPAPMYLAMGFAPTGEIDEDEIVARLDLQGSHG